jgi:hypothetical protein
MEYSVLGGSYVQVLRRVTYPVLHVFVHFLSFLRGWTRAIVEQFPRWIVQVHAYYVLDMYGGTGCCDERDEHVETGLEPLFSYYCLIL